MKKHTMKFPVFLLIVLPILANLTLAGGETSFRRTQEDLLLNQPMNPRMSNVILLNLLTRRRLLLWILMRVQLLSLPSSRIKKSKQQATVAVRVAPTDAGESECRLVTSDECRNPDANPSLPLCVGIRGNGAYLWAHFPRKNCRRIWYRCWCCWIKFWNNYKLCFGKHLVQLTDSGMRRSQSHCSREWRINVLRQH